MISDNTIIKMIFGFKVKYLRQQKSLSYEQLAEITGLSKSYLHDIEKGRKYPKVDKINALASAFEVGYNFLVSTQASKKLQPLIDLLSSDFVKEFPLEEFGIQPDKLFELFSNTPDKVNAFINTIFKLTRNYQLQREHLYMTALRSFQDMHDNYFESLERAVQYFKEEYQINYPLPLKTTHLEELLQKVFGISVDRTAMAKQGNLKGQRSYFSKKKQTLFINQGLKFAQENFLLGRELAFQYLKLSERPYFTRILGIDSFEKLLNNFKASYFSIALLMPEQQLIQDLNTFLQEPNWNPNSLLHFLEQYDVTPEMFLQRLTNILSKHFGINDLFFIRLVANKDLSYYRMTKELHLSQVHKPHANETNEHYCRRWVSVNIIKRARGLQQLQNDFSPIADAQISKYFGTNNEYLCLSISNPGRLQAEETVSLTIGLMINDQVRRQIRFLNDPKLPSRTVNTTCEQCSILDCEARAATPKVLEQQNQIQRVQEGAAALEK